MKKVFLSAIVSLTLLLGSCQKCEKCWVPITDENGNDIGLEEVKYCGDALDLAQQSGLDCD